MTIGINNAPATFQKATGVNLATVKWGYELAYINGTNVFSPSTEDHIKNVKFLLHLID